MIFVLSHAQARQRAIDAIKLAPDGWRVKLTEPAKTRDQEERYHAMIGDIAKQWEFMGRKWDQESMKRLLIDLFASEMRAAGTPLKSDGSVVPSIDGQRVVQLGAQSRRFSKQEGSAFIDFLNAFAAEREIAFNEI